jgi:hypothetical protein
MEWDMFDFSWPRLSYSSTFDLAGVEGKGQELIAGSPELVLDA